MLESDLLRFVHTYGNIYVQLYDNHDSIDNLMNVQLHMILMNLTVD